jgi:hypothetical protein
MTGRTRILIASPPDREGLVAELYYDDEGWALVTEENGTFVVEIYASDRASPVKLSLDEAVEALREARRKLVEG